MGAAWFPSIPKRKGRRNGTYEINVITRKDDLEEGEIEEEDVESDLELDNDDEDSSDEESLDDDHLCDGREGIETLYAYVPLCFTKMFNIMIKYGEDAFPLING